MDIKILGSGCSNCAKLEKVTKEAIAQLGIVADVEKVEACKKLCPMEYEYTGSRD